MEIKKVSRFKDPKQDIAWFENWVNSLQSTNNRNYRSHHVSTSLGKTQVWSVNSERADLETLVIFPGARTTALIWDLDRGLDNLGAEFRIFMVETNGLPNLSDGKTPDIKSLDYGEWASEVLNELNLEKTYVAGASF